MPATTDKIHALAELIVRFGANVQPGQIVALSSAPGKEPLARAVAESAYKAGAKFVDLYVFDIHLKRARALYAAPDTLGFVPPWYGERMRAIGEQRGANDRAHRPGGPSRHGWRRPVAARQGPAARSCASRSRSSTSGPRTGRPRRARPRPGPTLVHPDLPAAEALERLWQDVAHVCRIDEPDPVAAWEKRMDGLTAVARKLDEMRLDALRFEGPGTDLTVGLLPSGRWHCARITTVDGIVHAPNLPTEEVFTTPDPASRPRPRPFDEAAVRLRRA